MQGVSGITAIKRYISKDKTDMAKSLWGVCVCVVMLPMQITLIVIESLVNQFKPPVSITNLAFERILRACLPAFLPYFFLPSSYFVPPSLPSSLPCFFLPSSFLSYLLSSFFLPSSFLLPFFLLFNDIYL